MNKKTLKIALVHDYLLKLGGAERVIKLLSEMYPEAPIYTLLYNPEVTKDYLDNKRIRPSSLQKLPKFIRNKHSLLINKFPKAIENFDFSKYDVVISSSNSFAHGIVTNSDTKHICYYHSPTRYLWDWTNEYLEESNFGFIKRVIAKYLFHKLRIWDKLASDRVDMAVANSETVKRRIEKYYQKEAVVIYPPVNINRFKILRQIEDYFLVVSTLSPYKKVDLVIDFFNKVGKKLIIVGEGKHKNYLESIAGPSITFLGRQSDEKVSELMSKCRGFIFPGEDDFGITPVEAMAAGRPVFAYNKGGVTETVIDKETGVFFEEANIDSFEAGFAKFLSFEKKFFDPLKARKRAEQYSENRFIDSIQKLVNS